LEDLRRLVFGVKGKVQKHVIFKVGNVIFKVGIPGVGGGRTAPSEEGIIKDRHECSGLVTSGKQFLKKAMDGSLLIRVKSTK
jgi:hypothetical protein